MGYPNYKEIELPLLRFIYEQGGNISASESYQPLGVYFELSVAEMTLTLNEVQGHGGNRSKWKNMIQWARNSLAKDKLIARPSNLERGQWKLTENGLVKAAADIESSKLPINYPDEVLESIIEDAKNKLSLIFMREMRRLVINV